MIRRVFHIAFVLSFAGPPMTAFAQGSSATIAGFGALSLNGFQSRTLSPSLGGAVTVNLLPGVQIVGEAGRLANVLPTIADTIFAVARTDLRASAFYGEGGIRFLASSGAIAPYVEGTVGMARLDVSSGRLGSIGNAATAIALGFVGRTTPMAGVGTGVLVRGGPIVFDAGYRYKQLFANDVLQAVLGFGQPLRTHQVRAGIGVRF